MIKKLENPQRNPALLKFLQRQILKRKSFFFFEYYLDFVREFTKKKYGHCFLMILKMAGNLARNLTVFFLELESRMEMILLRPLRSVGRNWFHWPLALIKKNRLNNDHSSTLRAHFLAWICLRSIIVYRGQIRSSFFTPMTFLETRLKAIPLAHFLG